MFNLFKKSNHSANIVGGNTNLAVVNDLGEERRINIDNTWYRLKNLSNNKKIEVLNRIYGKYEWDDEFIDYVNRVMSE